jgi:hypothetical protein
MVSPPSTSPAPARASSTQSPSPCSTGRGAFESFVSATPTRFSASISRKLRLLRAHGLIKKVPKTHRYLLTDNGHLLAVAVFATRNSDLNQLLSKAA